MSRLAQRYILGLSVELGVSVESAEVPTVDAPSTVVEPVVDVVVPAAAAVPAAVTGDVVEAIPEVKETVAVVETGTETGTADLPANATESAVVPETEDDAAGVDDAFLDNDEDEMASEVASIELVEAVNETRDAADVTQQVAAALEGLNELRDALTAFNARGGVTKEALPFIRIALEEYSTTFFKDGGIAIKASMESLQSDLDRQAFSLETLNENIATLENAHLTLEDNSKKAAQKLNAYLTHVPTTLRVQVESLVDGVEPSLVEPVINPMVVAEVAQDDALNQQQELQEDLTAALAGVVSIKSEIEAQNEAGGMSVESIVAAELALGAFTRPLGLKDVELCPEMEVTTESIAENKLVQVSVESIDIAVEGIGDRLKDVGKRVLSTVARANEFLAVRAPIMVARLNRLSKIAASEKPAAVKGVVKTNVKYLHRDGKTDGVTQKYLSEYFALSEILIGKFHVAAKASFETNSKLVSKLKSGFAKEGTGLEDFLKAIDDMAASWSDPRSMLSKVQLQFAVPGGRRLFVDKPLIYTGKSVGARKLDAFAHLNYPTRLLWRGGASLQNNIAELPVLTPKEISVLADEASRALSKINLLQAAIEQVSAVGTAAPILPVSLISALVKAIRRRKTYGALGTETRAIAAAYNTSNYMRFHVGYDAASTLMTVASALISYSKRSLKITKTINAAKA